TVYLPTEPKWERRLAAAADYIAEKDWQKAVMLLQSALDQPSDAFINVKHQGKDGKETTYRARVHAEAERMMRSLPAEGLAYYRATYQRPAADLLKQTDEKDRRKLLEEVSRRYLYTKAG